MCNCLHIHGADETILGEESLVSHRLVAPFTLTECFPSSLGLQ